MNQIIIGKRVPIGAAVNGLILFLGDIWNVSHPEAQLSLTILGGFAVTLTAIAQIVVVNLLGVTNAKPEG